MEKHYVSPTAHWWLNASFLVILTLAGQAQPVPPPVQWQRIIDADRATLPTGLAVPTRNGGFAVLAGTNLVRLSATGAVLTSTPLTGTYQDSSATYAPVEQALALAPTSDAGVVVLARDALMVYYVTKLDVSGNRVWTRPVANANTGSLARLTANAVGVAPDRSLLVAGTFTDGLTTYLTLTKLSPDGYITSEWRISYPGAIPTTAPVIRKILSTTDGGYLLAGHAVDATSTAGQGLAIKLDKQYNLTWQHTYPILTALSDVVANPAGGDLYTAIGPGTANSASVMAIAPNTTADGTVLVSLTNSYPWLSIANDGNGNLTILNATDLTNSDFRLTNVAPQSSVRWTRTFGGSGNDVPTMLLPADGGGYLLVGTTTSTDGDVLGKSTTTPAIWVIRTASVPPVTPLSLTTPTYNCQTGVIIFNTTGGDGTLITYQAPGIIRAQATDNFGTVEPGLRNDPKLLTIQATQSGQTVNSTFDFRAYCLNQTQLSVPAPGTLTLLAPTYNCQTGAITFHTSGGDSTTIEYAAPGITPWTTNPSQFVDRESRTAGDVQPFTLMARQSGKVVMYVFDLKAECGRARIAVEEVSDLNVTIAGNPVHNAVNIEITGAAGQSLLMNLIDGQGRLIEQRTVPQAGTTEQQTFDLRRQAAGVLFLRTSTANTERTVKVVKQ